MILMETMHLSSNQFMTYEPKYKLGDTIHNWNKLGTIIRIERYSGGALITMDVKSINLRESK